MSDAAADLIRDIAVEHSVALDRSDPILILQTATRKILQDVLVQAQAAMNTAMASHRSELELAASKWQADSKRTASQLVQDVQAAIAKSSARELTQACTTATAQLQKALQPHDKALARATLTCSIAAAVSALAAAAVIFSRFG